MCGGGSAAFVTVHSTHPKRVGAATVQDVALGIEADAADGRGLWRSDAHALEELEVPETHRATGNVCVCVCE